MFRAACCQWALSVAAGVLACRVGFSEDIKPAEPVRKRGSAVAEGTRPKSFPHRIWAACDFEGRTPDYAWFGPAETTNIPKYPGNVTALGVKDKSYGKFSALMTGINPVPGPMMGKVNKMYCRYFLKGGTEATFQHFSLTREDNNHIKVSGLTEGKWSELTLNFTRDAARNDGSKEAFQKGERMDDLKVFVGKPGDGKNYELYLDDIMFFDDDPEQAAEREPFPRRVIFVAAFDTGVDAKSKLKYYPGEWESVRKDAPKDSYWGVAKAVTRKGPDVGQWVHLDIKPPRPVGADTKVRFRYHLSAPANLVAQVHDVTAQDQRQVKVVDAKAGMWVTQYADIAGDGKCASGKQSPFAVGNMVDGVSFLVDAGKNQNVQLLIDEVVLFDARRD